MIESPRLVSSSSSPIDNNTPDQNDLQKAKIKRIVGIALICVGLVFAAVSFGVSYNIIAMPATAKVILGLILGAASLASLIAGTILKNKYTPADQSSKHEDIPESLSSDDESLSPRVGNEESDDESVSPRVEKKEYMEPLSSPRKTDVDAQKVAAFEKVLEEKNCEYYIDENGWDFVNDEKLKNVFKKKFAEELKEFESIDEILISYGEDIFKYDLVDAKQIEKQVFNYLIKYPKDVLYPADNESYDLLVKYSLIPQEAKAVISDTREKLLELRREYKTFKEEFDVEVNNIQEQLLTLQATHGKLETLKEACEQEAKLVAMGVSAIFEEGKKSKESPSVERVDSPGSEIGSPYFSDIRSSSEKLGKYKIAFDEYQKANAKYEFDLMKLKDRQEKLEKDLEEGTKNYKKDKKELLSNFAQSLNQLLNKE